VNPDIVGWISTGILICTIGRQALTQWKQRSTAGLSRWLFIGQLAASVGFVIYSVLLGNVVFVVSNVFLLLIAIVGQVLYVRNRKRESRRR
jgi:MtN3 and saliva related transmembrane protein